MSGDNNSTGVNRVLDGQIALVTGSTRGIGMGIAFAMAAAGAYVVVTGRSREAATAVAAEIGERGGQASAIGFDLGDDDAVDAIVPSVLNAFGGLDILVNNAGIDADNLIINHPLEDWRRIMRMNVEVPFRLSKAAAPHFFEKARGVIINVSSILGFVASPEAAAYVPAKHALVGLTKQLAVEWARQGVRVNGIAPGLIQTDLTQNMWGNDSGASYVARRIPSGRIGQAEDIGGVAVFLASPAADFIHGETIVVDGGTLLL